MTLPVQLFIILSLIRNLISIITFKTNVVMVLAVGTQRLEWHLVRIGGPGSSVGSGFGGLVVSVLASGTQDRGFEPLVPKIAGSNPAEAVGFFGRKSPQHAFLRRGSKAVRPMPQICGMLKTPGNYVEVRFSGKICRPFLALPEGSHVAWRAAPLGLTGGTKGGAQRAC